MSTPQASHTAQPTSPEHAPVAAPQAASAAHTAASSSDAPLKRMVFGYTGEVEGGDFKYMALRNAHRAGVTGSIASAAHGFAELCVQGTSEQIAHFRELLAHCIAHNHVECNLAETHEADVVINERTFLPNA